MEFLFSGLGSGRLAWGEGGRGRPQTLCERVGAGWGMELMMRQLAVQLDLERTPTAEEYSAMPPDVRRFVAAFKPKVVRRVAAGTMPATFQVFNVDRVLRENAELRHQVGFALSIGKPTKAMVLPSVWIVTPAGAWVETTHLDLDKSEVLFTTKDPALEQVLENWFQTSRRTTSSQIKNVAMVPSHPHHISLAQFKEDRENLLIKPEDPVMRTVRQSAFGMSATTTVPIEQTENIQKKRDLQADMDATVGEVVWQAAAQ